MVRPCEALLLGNSQRARLESVYSLHEGLRPDVSTQEFNDVRRASSADRPI